MKSEYLEKIKERNGSISSKPSLRVAIDASRNRSGGAIAHLIGILNEIKPEQHGILEVHVWSYIGLLNSIDDKPYLIKHRSDTFAKSTFLELMWQRYALPAEIKRQNCDILLNCDAGTVSDFQPSVTMSRDMLSYEDGEIERYGFSKARLRLIFLRSIQNRSLRRATGVIFLTKYAAQKIMLSCGNLKNHRVIPHGVSDQFRSLVSNLESINQSKRIKLIYVSNVDWYKHQWNVVKSIKLLRNRGWDLELHLVGGGTGAPMRYLEKVVAKEDPRREFVKLFPFVKHRELPNTIAENNIFIFASSCENMPNTLIEGMCSGLPIVCSERGPMPEVLGDSGKYFDPENVESICRAIETYLINPDLAVELAASSRILSEQYSWRRCAEETMNFLVEVYKKMGN